MHCAYLALQVRVAVLAWKVKKTLAPVLQSTSFIDTYWVLTGRETGVFYFSWGKSCEQEKKQRGGVVSLQCRRFLRARKCFCSWKLRDGGYNNMNKTRTRFRPPMGVFPALLLRAAIHYPNAWNGLCQHGPRGLGLPKSHYGSWSARRHD